ncbi:hypothetical protein FHU38_002627 [Saccharomonospora amisosensis]|uniref:Nitroreductase family protein n=1 Tax=Saccharomonospora amisosensis TaxID=1128677 RepID=A0A7X5UR81_9PSEU|nr:hypothetical protein [Saccharomonospora amisosensis]NIJ12283.1 hypothetical protein [Saccharomonospora amisosensis]
MSTEPLAPSPPRHSWSEQEKGVLTRTALHTQACGQGSPWTLEIHGPRAEIFERFHSTLLRHDATGRDRVISCGAVLANLLVAVRVLGWLPEVALLGDAARPDLVATVTARTRNRPSAVDVRYFQAVFDRRRHRETIDPTELPSDVLAEIVQAGASTDVQLVPITSFVPAHRKQPLEPGLLVVTVTDGRRDQVLAGVSMQHAWLAARTRGLTASPRVEPFQSREFRQRMLRRCGLAGSPQLLLRLGT